MVEHKEYHSHPDEPNNESLKIKFIITYKKGIGYYICVVPVKISKSGNIAMEEIGAFTGFNDSLIMCSRKSKKSLEASIKLLNERKEKYLNYFKHE